MRKGYVLSPLPLVAMLVAGSAAAQDATTALEATSPYPTFENLSVRWEITGDDDTDGRVSVRYRKAGDEDWKTGMPLRRVPAGSHKTGFTWANHHAGSL